MRSERGPTIGFTIDGPYSRDLDDAIYLRRTPSGWTVYVSIADVASAISKNSPLDVKAREQGYTRYFATGNEPMLPPCFSEDQMSLLEGKERPVITVEIPLSHDLVAGEPTIRPMTLSSKAKLSHQQVDQILAAPEHELRSQLADCSVIAQQLLTKRRRDGALALYDIFSGWATTEEGLLCRIRQNEAHVAYVIVQEFMILANRAIAEFFASRGIPALFRNHTAQPLAPDRDSILQDLMLSLEYPTRFSIETLQKRVALTLNRATYGPRLQGHYGLNLAAYVHFTSPIRRYPDLVNHRILHAVLAGTELPYSMDELEKLGEALAEQDRVQKDRRSDDLREEAYGHIRAQIARDQLKSLSRDQFSKVIKLACRGDELTDSIETEILSRWDSGDLMGRDAYSLLFEANSATRAWIRIKKQTLNWLVMHPGQAISILNSARQDGICSLAEFHNFYQGLDHNRLYTVEGTVQFKGILFKSKPFRAKMFNLGQKKAACDLVIEIACHVAGLSRDVFDLPTLAADEDVGEQRNHIGQLLDLCAAQHWSHPHFGITVAGLDHQPTFTCVATMSIKGSSFASKPSVGKSKRHAEHMAAADLLEQLRARKEHKLAEKPDQIARCAASGNFVSALQEWCQGQGRQLPRYLCTMSGAPHLPIISCVCMVSTKDGADLSYTGQANNQKTAKQLAAKLAYEALIVTRS